MLQTSTKAMAPAPPWAGAAPEAWSPGTLLARALGGSRIDSGVASGGGSVRRGSSGVRGGVSSLASSSGGVSSSFLRGFDGFFLLGAAGEDQGGEGGGESDLRVH